MKLLNRNAMAALRALTALLLLGPIFAVAAPSQESAEIQQVREGMQKLVSGHPITAITLSPIPGLYEVMVGMEIFYVSADGKYLLSGKLFDIASRSDLTTPKLKQVKADALNGVDEADMVIFSPKDYKYTITVFTDIDCGYCRKLHSEIKDYNDRGIRVRYMMFPRAGIGSASYQKAVNVWCSKDRNQALTRAKAGETLEEQHCDNPVADQYALGQKLGVTGTPAIFLADGELVPGYVPAQRMEAMLKNKAQP
jgi:thiol:disulfide interchange protein DsbC